MPVVGKSTPWFLADLCVRRQVIALTSLSVIAVSALSTAVIVPFTVYRSESYQEKQCRRRDTGCLQSGAWVRTAKPTNLYALNNCSASFFHFCTKRLPSRMQKILQWDWQPSDRTCRPMDPTSPWLLYSLAAQKRILLLGDSLTEEQFYSLRCLFPQSVILSEAMMPDSKMRDFKLRNNATITFQRLDKLVNITGKDTTKWELRGDWPMLQVAEADLIVLNTGAHRQGRLPQHVEAIGETVASHLAAANHHGVFVYRSSFMPGDECHLEEQPLQNVEDIPTRNEYYTAAYFSEIDAAWKRVFDRWGPRFVFYNVSLAASLRVDGHPGLSKTNKSDCLHFCLPGVQDL